MDDLASGYEVLGDANLRVGDAFHAGGDPGVETSHAGSRQTSSWASVEASQHFLSLFAKDCSSANAGVKEAASIGY